MKVNSRNETHNSYFTVRGHGSDQQISVLENPNEPYNKEQYSITTTTNKDTYKLSLQKTTVSA
jgi:hypothetical protein